MLQSHRYLWLECLLCFGGLPMLVYLTRDRALAIGLLWVFALLGVFALKRHNAGFNHRAEWNMAGARAGAGEVLRRFCMLSPLLLAFTVLHDFDRLFSFPLNRPFLWATVMLLYPILSVWPQEWIFRGFFYHRYLPILRTPERYAAVSALAFSYAHIVFSNWVALLFTAIGGYMFARTYVRHRSLALVCFEHALYGCLVFTLGLGWYFYGAAWRR